MDDISRLAGLKWPTVMGRTHVVNTVLRSSLSAVLQIGITAQYIIGRNQELNHDSLVPHRG